MGIFCVVGISDAIEVGGVDEVEGSCCCGVEYAWLLPPLNVRVALPGDPVTTWIGFVSVLEARRGSVVAIVEAIIDVMGCS